MTKHTHHQNEESINIFDLMKIIEKSFSEVNIKKVRNKKQRKYYFRRLFYWIIDNPEEGHCMKLVQKCREYGALESEINQVIEDALFISIGVTEKPKPVYLSGKYVTTYQPHSFKVRGHFWNRISQKDLKNILSN